MKIRQRRHFEEQSEEVWRFDATLLLPIESKVLSHDGNLYNLEQRQTISSTGECLFRKVFGKHVGVKCWVCGVVSIFEYFSGMNGVGGV